MTLIVEDGTAKVDADALVDLLFVDEFLANVPAWINGLGENKEQAIKEATVFFCAKWGHKMPGKRTTGDQALSYPRIEQVDRDGNSLADDVTPTAVKRCVAMLSYAALLAPLVANRPTNASPNNLKEKTVKLGPITTTTKYEAGDKQATALYPEATIHLYQLVTTLASAPIGQFRTVKN